MAALQIRLLGGLELRLDGAVLPPLESARAESLLAYLLLHRDAPQSRQRLAFLLWPDSTEPQARTNLRHVLHNLRRALPDADRLIEITPRTLQWRPDAPLRLDVEVFETALARAGGDDVEALREAAAAYAGDLLEGAYDEWLLEERERLRERHLDALERLATLLAERGEHDEAIRHAERLLRADPLREQAYRLLMRLHDARGERARALRVFHACSAALERELGVTPSAPTRELYAALLPSREREPEPEPAAAHWGGLVGRVPERARLARLWGASERGRAQLVLVTGEAGIGKTRLVEELRRWCDRRGAVTAEGRSYSAEGALAYGPVAAWLRAEPLAARRRLLDRGTVGELARLLPELGARPPEPPPGGQQRQRLFDALARALLAPAAPLLLIADDLQWADRDTLQFLHYLVRTAPDAPLLVAATVRREELDEPDPVQELVTGLKALERCVEIELGRLSQQETAELAQRVGGGPPAPTEAERLFARTEGNPLFVVEALRAGWDGEDESSVSPRVQAVIEARLARLSARARDLAGVAAAVGREFTADVLAAAGEIAEAELVRALDELWRRRIVRDRGPDAYDFTHDRIREVAYRGLSPARRARTHRLIAAALERLHADDLDAVSGQVATHYERAGLPERAIEWYERAAAIAQRMHAHAEALSLLERALRLVDALPATTGRHRRELDLATAALVPAGIVDGYVSSRVHALQRRGLDAATRLGAEPEPPLLRAVAVTALSDGEYERSHEFASRLRARGEHERDDVLLVESDYVLGISAFWQGSLRAAREHFEAAIARYRPEHRATHLARYGLDPKVICLSRLGNTLWFLGEPDAAVRAREEALALAEEIGHPPSAATARMFAALLALELRDDDDFRRHAATLAARPRELELRPIRSGVKVLAAYADILDGRWESGLARLRSGVEEAGVAEYAPGHFGSMLRLLAEGCALSGDLRGGLAATERLLGTGRTGPWRAEALRLRAEFRAGLGAAAADVAADLDTALEVARVQGALSFELRIAASREALLGRGTLPERHLAHPPVP